MWLFSKVYKNKELKEVLNDLFTEYLGNEGIALASRMIAEISNNDPVCVISNHIEIFMHIVERLRDLKYILILRSRWRCPACSANFISISDLLRHISTSNDDKHRKLRSKFSLIDRKTKFSRINVLKDLIWIEL